MEQLWRQDLPVNPAVVEGVVNHMKSHGIFDRFRYDSLSDVDTKPAYQNLSQRVDGFVTKFLSTEEWNPDLNKNELRNKLRRHIEESGMLATGVDHVVDQVVNPKIHRVFRPKVEDIVSGYLLEKQRKEKEKALFESSSSTTTVKTEPQTVLQSSENEISKMKLTAISGCDSSVPDPVSSIIDKPIKKIEEIATRKELKPVGSPGKAPDVHKPPIKNVVKPIDVKPSTNQKVNVDQVKKDPDGPKKIKTEETSQPPLKPKIPDKKKEETTKQKSDVKLKDNIKPKSSTSQITEKHSSKLKNDSRSSSVGKSSEHKHSETKSTLDSTKSKSQKSSTDKHKEQKKDKLNDHALKAKHEDKKVKEKGITSSDLKAKEPSKEKSNQHKDKGSTKSTTKPSESSKDGHTSRSHEKSSCSSTSKSKENRSDKSGSRDPEKFSNSNASKSSDSSRDKNVYRDKDKSSSSKSGETSKHKSALHDKDKHGHLKSSEADKDKHNREKSHSHTKAHDEGKSSHDRERSSSSKYHDHSNDKSGNKVQEKSKHSGSTSKTSEKGKHHTSSHGDKSSISHSAKKNSESKDIHDKEKPTSSKSKQKLNEGQKEENCHDLARSTSSSSVKGQDGFKSQSSESSSSAHSMKTTETGESNNTPEESKKNESSKQDDTTDLAVKTDSSTSVTTSEETQNDKSRDREKVNNSNPILKTKAPTAGLKVKVDNFHPILRTKLPDENSTQDKNVFVKDKEALDCSSEKSSSNKSRELLNSGERDTVLDEQNIPKKIKPSENVSRENDGDESTVKNPNKGVTDNIVIDSAKEREPEESVNESDEEKTSSEDSEFDSDKSKSSSEAEDSDSDDEEVIEDDGTAEESKDYSSTASEKSPRRGEPSAKSSAASIRQNTKPPASLSAAPSKKDVKIEKDHQQKQTVDLKQESSDVNSDESSDESSSENSDDSSSAESSSSSDGEEAKNVKTETKNTPKKGNLMKNDKVESADKISNQEPKTKVLAIKKEDHEEGGVKVMEIETKPPESIATSGLRGCRKRKLNPKYASSEYASIFNSRMQMMEDSNASTESLSTDVTVKNNKAQSAKVSDKVPKTTISSRKTRARSPSDSGSDNKSMQSNSSEPPKKKSRKTSETEYKITLKISKVQEESSRDEDNDDEEDDDDEEDEKGEEEEENDDDDDEDDNISSPEPTDNKKRSTGAVRGRPRKNAQVEAAKPMKRTSRANSNQKSIQRPALRARRTSLRDRRKHSESGESVSSDRSRRKSTDLPPKEKSKCETPKQENQQRSSKRYDSSDLYKPRPVIHSSTRRNRAQSPPHR